MDLILARVQPRRRTTGPSNDLLAEFLQRCGRFQPTQVRDFASEERLLGYLDQAAARRSTHLVLTDLGGVQVSSPEFAAQIGRWADGGCRELILAVGPPDGWTAPARARAALTIAFGRITLPHELAAVVLSEQMYRALTILAGHPYHSGHE